MSEYFQGRGIIDLRVFPSRPETLFVYVHFFCELADPVDLGVLHALAAEAGITAERGCCYGQSAWIEVPVAATEGVVIPFPAAKKPAGHAQAQNC